ncbi:hypothetical protein ACOSQ2_005700 [Xanthoceras sorbifolium]
MENVSNKTCPDFFKVYLPARNSHTLHIPDEFVARCGRTLPKTVMLSNHVGKFWHVNAAYTEQGVNFLNGWHKFAQDNSLQYGDFLLFQYNGDRGFYVKNLGQFEPENSGTGANGTTTYMNQVNLEEDDDDDDDSDDEDYNEEEEEDTTEEEEEEDEDDDDDDDDRATIENSRAQKRSGGIYGGSKRRAVVKEGGSKQTSDVMVVEAATVMRKNKDQKKSSESNGGSKGTSDAKDGGFERTTFKSEKVDVSKYVQPRNPHFIAKLRKGTKKHLLLVPSKVIKQYKLDLPNLMIFQNEHGRKWPGHISHWNDGRTWISGWKDFCIWNDVGLDDWCICEFLRGCNGQKGDIIQVHIIRNASSGS